MPEIRLPLPLCGNHCKWPSLWPPLLCIRFLPGTLSVASGEHLLYWMLGKFFKITHIFIFVHCLQNYFQNEHTLLTPGEDVWQESPYWTRYYATCSFVLALSELKLNWALYLISLLPVQWNHSDVSTRTRLCGFKSILPRQSWNPE